MSDDLSMQALSGSFRRAGRGGLRGRLRRGAPLQRQLDEMAAGRRGVAGARGRGPAAGARRRSQRIRHEPEPFDPVDARARLDAALAMVAERLKLRIRLGRSSSTMAAEPLPFEDVDARPSGATASPRCTSTSTASRARSTCCSNSPAARRSTCTGSRSWRSPSSTSPSSRRRGACASSSRPITSSWRPGSPT